MLKDTFHDPALFELACTHRSMDATRNNQRLEFLGDRVLGLVVSDMLYHHFPEEREGDLAMRHAALVCADALTHIAQKLNFGTWLIMAEGEQRSGGSKNPSNLSDMAEAIIGALYLDQGLSGAQSFIEEHWTPLLHQDITPPKDNKTLLQEWAQAQGLPLPEYTETQRTGPDHAPEFTIEVLVQGYSPQQANGTSKRDAQQQAAKKLLKAQGAI